MGKSVMNIYEYFHPTHFPGSRTAAGVKFINNIKFSFQICFETFSETLNKKNGLLLEGCEKFDRCM